MRSKIFWEEEPQRRKQAFGFAKGEKNGACGDETALDRTYVVFRQSNAAPANSGGGVGIKSNTIKRVLSARSFHEDSQKRLRSKIFWEEEPQRRKQAFGSAKGEKNGTCGDEAALQRIPINGRTL